MNKHSRARLDVRRALSRSAVRAKDCAGSPQATTQDGPSRVNSTPTGAWTRVAIGGRRTRSSRDSIAKVLGKQGTLVPSLVITPTGNVECRDQTEVRVGPQDESESSREKTQHGGWAVDGVVSLSRWRRVGLSSRCDAFDGPPQAD